jgi:hypothetical protein
MQVQIALIRIAVEQAGRGGDAILLIHEERKDFENFAGRRIRRVNGDKKAKGEQEREQRAHDGKITGRTVNSTHFISNRS